MQLRAEGHDARHPRDAGACGGREGHEVGGVPATPQAQRAVARGGLLDRPRFTQGWAFWRPPAGLALGQRPLSHDPWAACIRGACHLIHPHTLELGGK